MAGTLSFDRLRSILVATVTHLPEHRTGPHRLYEIADAALGAFAVFFTQSPSFLAYQRDMQRRKGRNNAQSLFGVDQVPTDPQIRNLLDPIAPEHLAAPFWRVFEQLQHGDYLKSYQGWLGRWLLALSTARSTSIRPRSTVRSARPGSSTNALHYSPCVGGAADCGAGA